MTNYSYATILKNAKTCKTSVEKKYTIGVSSKWAYYFAKSIVAPKKDIKKFTFNTASNPTGTNISRQIVKADYIDIAKRLIKYVETKRALPNYITYKSFKIRTRVYVYMFAKIVVYYGEHNQLPNYVSISSKAFTKPTETTDEVYNYFVKKTGKKFATIDDFLEYVKSHWHYEYYFDDKKSNKEVIDEKGGNCTDLTQMASHMAEAMGYEWKCIHVKCRQSGTGHVFNKFRKKGSSSWFTRDIASVADGGAITSVWCENGYLLGENPQWWLANRNR